MLYRIALDIALIESVSGEGKDNNCFCHSEVDYVSKASEGPAAGGEDGAAAGTCIGSGYHVSHRWPVLDIVVYSHRRALRTDKSEAQPEVLSAFL